MSATIATEPPVPVQSAVGTVTASPRAAVENLTVRIASSKTVIVDDVSIEVAAGKILGVVGESGSGKTTLGLAMIGHARRGLEISHGAVRVDGRDLIALSSRERTALYGSAMTYVPQDPGTALNPARRIGSQLREILTVHGVKKRQADERVREILGEVGLDGVGHVLSAYPHQLSGGQQQRVAIAMAFACRPGLIVMDEPTTGLDVTTQRTVLDTVRSLCSKYGVAAIYVSHDVAVVAELADEIAVLYAGKIVESGPAVQVFGSPEHPYTRGLLRAVPSAERRSRLLAMPGVRPELGNRSQGCAFAPRCWVSESRCHQLAPALVAVPAGSDGSHAARCHVAPGVAAREAIVLGVPVADTVQDEADDAASTSVLQVSDLSAHYGSKKVLHDISLSIGRNECLALVGESGSGKTTLSRCLVGLHREWSGHVLLGDEELTPGVGHRSRDTLRRMQYVFQNPYASLNPRRTVGGLLLQPLDHFTRLGRRERNQRVVSTLDAVSLPRTYLAKYPDQLSGGERQRVAIARALVVQPQVLVCDEVTSALDVSVQASVIEVLRDLQVEQELSILFITHNLPLVRSIAQRVAVMSGGRVIEYGDTDSVLDNPQAEYTQQLMEHLPRFEAPRSAEQL